MSENAIEIRSSGEADKASWRLLFDGYARFYKMPMTDGGAATVWAWLQDPSHVLQGLLAHRSGDVVGLAHFRAMPSPLRGVEVGFLDDLFVAPEARGDKVAEALFTTMGEEGRRRGWPFIRWLTADDNYRARGLYDRVAHKTGWNTYQMDL